MKLRVLIIIVVLLCLHQLTNGQGISADPFTGRPNASLPLWTVHSADLSAPISLNYSGPPKMTDGEGSAGMGWQLLYGGEIRRDLRGLPDDFVGAVSGITGDLRNGWLHQGVCRSIKNYTPVADADLTSCADEIPDWNFLNGFGYTADTEPDIFSFRAPGLSGQFIFDNNKQLKTIPYQDLKIVTTRGADSLINQIIVTTNLGVQYTFQAGDKIGRNTSPRVASNYVNAFTSLYNYFNVYGGITYYYSSWYLSKITSPSGAVITCTYSDAMDAIDSYPVQAVNNANNSLDTLYFITDRINFKQIKTITGANELATFQWQNNTIGSLAISDLTQVSANKKFNFYYQTFNSYKNPNRWANTQRQFLTSVVEEVNCNVFPGYQFEYHGLANGLLPFGLGIQQDLFGYYNGSATSYVPEIYKTKDDTGQDGERYRFLPAPGYGLIGAGGGRGVNPNLVMYAALKTITLPSGGTTTVTYEANDFYDPLISGNSLGSGARVKSITTNANDPASAVTTTYRYTISKNSNQSSGAWTYKPVFVIPNGTDFLRIPSNIAPDEGILYSRIEIATSGQGKKVVEYLVPGVYPQTSLGDFYATLTRVARPDPQGGPCLDVGNIRTGYYSFPYSYNTNYDFERGLPSVVTEYTVDWKLVRRTAYTYQRTTLPVSVVEGIKFEKLNGIFQYGKYKLLGNVNKLSLTDSVSTYDQSYSGAFIKNVSNYTYNGNQMLKQLATVNSDNTAYYTIFQYAKDYALTGTDAQSLMIKSLVSGFRHGTLIETISKSGTAFTGGKLTLFGNFGSRVLPAQQLQLGDPTGFFASKIASGAFTYSTNYYPVEVIDSYDNLGNVIGAHDLQRIPSARIMGYNGTLVTAEVGNASNDQIVYSDFEPGLNSTVTTTGTVVNTDCWTGKNSLLLNPGNMLQQTVVNKGIGNYYRFSAWAKSSSSASISVQLTGGATMGVNYTGGQPNANGWQFIEGLMDVSAVPSTFSFSITTNAPVFLDNVAFYPEAATLIAHSYDPLIGKTADLAPKGAATFMEYDQLGRLHYVKNQDKDIVQIKDYNYQNNNGVLPVSIFTGNLFPKMNNEITFKALPSCLDAVGYSWSIDGVIQSSKTSQLKYVFTEFRDYTLTLVAISANYGSSSTTVTVKPTPEIIKPVITLAPGESRTIDVRTDATGVRDFSVNYTGSIDQGSGEQRWQISTDGGKSWEEDISVRHSTTFTYGRTDKSFMVRCQFIYKVTNKSKNYTLVSSGYSNTISITVKPCSGKC